jgi:hypothetical protein
MTPANIPVAMILSVVFITILHVFVPKIISLVPHTLIFTNPNELNVYILKLKMFPIVNPIHTKHPLSFLCERHLNIHNYIYIKWMCQ